jgi:hypothetical protein
VGAAEYGALVAHLLLLFGDRVHLRRSTALAPTLRTILDAIPSTTLHGVPNDGLDVRRRLERARNRRRTATAAAAGAVAHLRAPLRHSLSAATPVRVGAAGRVCTYRRCCCCPLCRCRASANGRARARTPVQRGQQHLCATNTFLPLQ